MAAASRTLSKDFQALMAGAATVTDAAGRWWLRAFLDLFPERTAQWLTDAGARNLLLREGGGEIVCELRNERGDVLARAAAAAENVRPTIDTLLRQHRLAGQDVPLGLAMEPARLFAREFLLPREAGRALAAIAEQDLLRKTPFRLADIHHDHAAHPEGDRLRVRQWVVLRDFVAEAAEALGLAPEEVAFVEAMQAPAPGGGDAHPYRIRLRPSPAKARWLPRLALGLAASAGLIAALALHLEFQRQDAILADIAAQTASVRAEAQKARAALDARAKERATLDALRARKWDTPGLPDIWEELSRILPDHTWVSELRLTETPERRERRVVITGFSAAAADLVRLVDASPLFQDVALAAPIALDPIEQRERFTLQASVSAAPPAEAAR